MQGVAPSRNEKKVSPQRRGVRREFLFLFFLGELRVSAVRKKLRKSFAVSEGFWA